MREREKEVDWWLLNASMTGTCSKLNHRCLSWRCESEGIYRPGVLAGATDYATSGSRFPVTSAQVNGEGFGVPISKALGQA